MSLEPGGSECLIIPLSLNQVSQSSKSIFWFREIDSAENFSKKRGTRRILPKSGGFGEFIYIFCQKTGETDPYFAKIGAIRTKNINLRQLPRGNGVIGSALACCAGGRVRFPLSAKAKCNIQMVFVPLGGMSRNGAVNVKIISISIWNKIIIIILAMVKHSVSARNGFLKIGKILLFPLIWLLS